MGEAGECPKCRSNHVDYGEGHYSKGKYKYEAKCLDCGTKFEEVYDLVFADAVITEG